MARRRFLVSVLFCSAVMGLATTSAFAQGQGNGVVVDADGVLRTRTFPDPTGMLTRQRLAAAQAALVPDMAKPSKLRKVSLNRLEAVAAQQLASGQGLTDDMRYLAGLTRIRNVFFYPDTGDIVIAGTAEGFMTNTAGRPVGIHTGRAVLELQDLVVAMRAFPPSGKQAQAFVVSIDPTPEGLAKMRQYLVNISGRVTPADDQRIAMGLKENLGLQNIRIEGIPRTTHFAQVMVEADYRMKLIGIGLENPAVRIPSYVSKANPRSVSRNALQRWYFTPNYDCVRVSEDELAMALEGEGVQLLSEDQFVQADGRGVGRDGRPRQPGIRQHLYGQVRRTGCQRTGLRPVAKPDRHGDRRGLHPATRLLRTSELEDGGVRQRGAFPGRDLSGAQASRNGGQRRLEGQHADDSRRRRRQHSPHARAGFRPRETRREG